MKRASLALDELPAVVPAALVPFDAMMDDPPSSYLTNNWQAGMASSSRRVF